MFDKDDNKYYNYLYFKGSEIIVSVRPAEHTFSIVLGEFNAQLQDNGHFEFGLSHYLCENSILIIMSVEITYDISTHRRELL